jgi:hypothetical protein
LADLGSGRLYLALLLLCLPLVSVSTRPIFWLHSHCHLSATLGWALRVARERDSDSGLLGGCTSGLFAAARTFGQQVLAGGWTRQ